MGTTSAGASGSGSGLRAGGGIGWQSGAGRYMSSGGEMIAKSHSQAQIDNEVKMTIGALFSRTGTYVKESFCNSYIQGLYRELFTLSKIVRETDNYDKIAERYHIEVMESNFIFTLIDKLDDKFNKLGIDSRCIDIARKLLEILLFKALGVKGDPTDHGKAIIKDMRANIDFWNSLSGYFLMEMASILFLQEVERKVSGATFIAKESLEQRTNAVISDFGDRTRSKEGKVDYPQLLEYISKNWEWFKSEMTK